jgi:hypothetical protein
LVAHHADASFGNVVVTPAGNSIHDVHVLRGETTATITWRTEEPATSVISYGTSPTYELGTMVENTPVQEHALTLNDLIPGQRYHFEIACTFEDGSVSRSPNMTFKTVAPSNLRSDEFNLSA